jgi:hypothetical protein
MATIDDNYARAIGLLKATELFLRLYDSQYFADLAILRKRIKEYLNEIEKT